MRTQIIAAAHATTPGHISHVAAAITALVVAAVIVIVLKAVGGLLSPRKPKSGSRSGLYAARK